MKSKACLNQKKAIISSLTGLKNKTLQDINDLDSTELKIRKNRFDVIGEELKTLFDNLFSLFRDDEIKGYILEKQELLDTWEEMLILLERRVSDLNKTNKSTEVIHTRNSDSTEIKLPTLSLPTFSGVIDECLTFSDLFQAAVTNNQNLTGAQKLQYLKGVLKGDAQKIVQSLPITDGNFQIAWDLLKERYFHKSEILSSLMKKLMNISPITCESHAQILKLVDSTKECVRLLETLDLKVEGTADIILMFIIQFKLDSTTRGFDSNSQVLLCTALVNVCDSFGGTRLCRVLLDPGSQACLITSSCLERLGLPRKRTNVRISCLGASDTRTNGISEIKFTPHFTSNISFVTSVYVVNKIVGQLPHFSLDSSWFEPFSDLKLADPTFFF
ncbi:DUF1758 domain-containing protein [Trichonephila clavipes]|nr:DUF1758 domain-containing protein [Trichonephila clavipes]